MYWIGWFADLYVVEEYADLGNIHLFRFFFAIARAEAIRTLNASDGQSFFFDVFKVETDLSSGQTSNCKYD